MKLSEKIENLLNESLTDKEKSKYKKVIKEIKSLEKEIYSLEKEIKILKSKKFSKNDTSGAYQANLKDIEDKEDEIERLKSLKSKWEDEEDKYRAWA